MDIKIKKSMEGTGYNYKVGEVVEDADLIMGVPLATYLIEEGHAEPVKGKTEKAVIKNGETPEGK